MRVDYEIELQVNGNCHKNLSQVEEDREGMKSKRAYLEM
jgi:hypothetical protein